MATGMMDTLAFCFVLSPYLLISLWILLAKN